MSVIRKKPFIEEVVDLLTIPQKESLLSVMNTAGNNVEASLLNMPAKGIKPVLFKFDEANIKTGILIYLDGVPVTLIAYHRFQDVLLFRLYPNETRYEKVNEYCDINELRRILGVGNEVTAGEIISGATTPANKVLASDGEGGAHWVDTADTIKEDNVEAGDAVKLFGFDSEGNLVADNIPEGITVDQTIIEDSENAVAGGAVYDELADINAELETKANVDGNYPTMTVGAADNLTPYSEDAGDDQDVPFLFQGTGCGNSETQVDTGALALLKEKRGNTVVANQLRDAYKASGTYEGVILTNNTTNISLSGTSNGNNQYIDLTPLINFKRDGRKYLMFTNKNIGEPLTISGYGGSQQSSDSSSYFIFSATADSDWRATIAILDTTVTEFNISNLEVYCIDLTQWFNGDIPADLLAHPENFFRYYQGSLANNTGELVNANSRYLKAIGRNAFDKSQTTANRYVNPNTGALVSSNDHHATGFIRVNPNDTYHLYLSDGSTGGGIYGAGYSSASESDYVCPVYLTANGNVTIPSNVLFIRFTLANAQVDQASFSIYYEDESGYDQYYTYEVLTNNDTGTETLRSAGSVADSKAPDGTIHRLVGVYTFTGEETWGYNDQAYGFKVWYVNMNTLIPNSKSSIAGGIKATLSKYVRTNAYVANMAENTFTLNDLVFSDSKFLIIRSDSNTHPDLTGAVLHYELETPTIEQGTPYSENIVIDDFGSMDFSGTSGVPQGNLIFYPVDYKAFIDSLYNELDGSANKVLSTETSQSDLDTYLNSKGYYKIQDYTLQVTDIILDTTYLRVFKCNKIVTISLEMTNQSGSDIAADTPLFKLPMSITTAASVGLVALIDGSPSWLEIDSRGASLSDTLPDNAVLLVSGSFIIV